MGLLALALAATACGSGETGTEDGGGATPTETGTAASFTTLEEGKLVVGSCLDYKPFEWYQGQTLKGFDVELTEAIASELGLEVKWVKANFETIFTALDAGKFDMVAAASTILPEREKVVDFSEPYYASRQSLTVNTSETPDIASTADLGDGDTVAVQKGTTGKIWAEDNLVSQGVELKTFDLAPDMFTDLEARNVTGIINDEPASIAEVEGRPDLEVVEAIDTDENYGLATSQENPELLAAVNGAFQTLIDDGTYQSIFEKYFPDLPLPDQFQPSG